MKITIDGRTADVAAGATVLDAARAMGISIPTLCDHRRLVPYAACRICLVEVAGRRLPAPREVAGHEGGAAPQVRPVLGSPAGVAVGAAVTAPGDDIPRPVAPFDVRRVHAVATST